MVSPIFLFAVALAVAFLLPLIRRIGAAAVEFIVFAVLVFMVFVPASYLPTLIAGGAAVEVITGGAAPPLTINLSMGMVEAIILTLVNLVAIGSLVRLTSALRVRLADGHVRGYALFMLMVMGANGIILTRDLFNIFVFLEIMSIATYGLLVLGRKGLSLQAAFKYIVAGGLASAVYLIGVILVYRETGTLNLDGAILAVATGGGGTAPAGGPTFLFVGVFLLLSAILIELKVFPANGWALDVYQAAHPGIAASVSAATASAVVVVLAKIAPLLSAELLAAVAWTGLLTFVASNLMGLLQRDERRMLGYSSVAQIGLVSFVIARSVLSGWNVETLLLVGGGLLLGHLLAKAALFWSIGAEGGSKLRSGMILASSAIAVFALLGLPPFPGFWSKWELVHLLAGSGDSLGTTAFVVILLGSLFEAVYLLRWLGNRVARMRAGSLSAAVDDETATSSMASAGRGTDGPSDEAWSSGCVIPIVLVAGIVTGLGAWIGIQIGFVSLFYWLPVAAVFAFLILDILPVRVNALFGVVAVAWFAYQVYSEVAGLAFIFAAIFAVGGVLVLIAVMQRRGRMIGLVPMIVGATGSLISLTLATTALEFFFAWEVLTVTTYLLVVRGTRSRGEESAAVRYAGFSIGGAFAVLAGLAILGAMSFSNVATVGITFGVALSTGPILIPGTVGWAIAADGAGIALILLALGFLSKAGALGLHVWLPGSYGRVDDEAVALFSGLVSKAAIFGLLIFAGALAVTAAVGPVSPEPFAALTALLSEGILNAETVITIIGWLGVATAVIGALLAIFQEDANQLLAYSSMSQVGYMILGVALMSHLGWVSSVYLVILHAILKLMLFLAIAGVIKRTGTSEMYRLGGLIKRMPVTFVSVLMAIIGVSGVPPLAGFGGKWLIYTALIEKGWYLQAGLAFFASAIAFLYLFRLIHTVFLGQLKDEHRTIREAPAALLIPQILLILGLMTFSMFPNLVLEPIIAAVAPFFATTVAWNDYTVLSSLGYWNGNLVMYVTMGVFALPLIWLVTVMRRPQHVEQFNIVYASERPERPETTHVAHNFYAHYRKALGFAVVPVARRFWTAVTGGVEATGAALRRIYTGNGQTYALHIVLFVVILFLAVGGLR